MTYNKSSNIKRIVARNLRTVRLEGNWTQQEVADRAGLNVTYYARLEKDPQNISLEGLQRLAFALNKKAYELLAGEEKELRSDIKKKLATAISLLRVIESEVSD